MARKRKRPPRTRLSTGIYQDRHGISIIIKGSEKGNRFPIGTPIEELRDARKELLDAAGPTVARRGTLAADVATYLATLPDDITTGIERRRRKSGAAMLLQHWLDAGFGATPRDAISDVQVKTQLAAWHNAGAAEATCDQRRRELHSLYTALNGKAGYNPVRAVPKFAPTYDDPRGFDMDVLRAILDSMPDRGMPRKGDRLKQGTFPTLNEAKVRLRVILECAIPPQTLKRVTAPDIDLRAKTLHTKRRRKGKGAKGRPLPLTARAVEALRAFMKAGLYGWYDQRAANRSFKAAVKRYRDAWTEEHHTEPPVPADLHATDLRHAYLSDLYRKSKNIKAVGYSAGHAPNSPQTNRYVQAAVPEVARAAVDAVEASTSASMNLSKNSKKPNKRQLAKPRPRTAKRPSNTVKSR